MDKHRFNYFFIFLISVLSLILFLVLKEANTSKLPDAEAYVPEYVNSSVNDVLKSEKAISPDGEMELTINTEPMGADLNWNLNINDERVANMALPVGWVVTLPYNSFSPDNKYFFVKEYMGSEYFYKVFYTKGGSINADGSELEITAPFNSRFPEFAITDITGWASPTLLLVNTNKTDGEEGPTFWFDITSKKFIRLSRRFN